LIADYLSQGDSNMLFSFLRKPRSAHKGSVSFRPNLEGLSDRIVPAVNFVGGTASSVDAAGALVVDFHEAGLGANETVTISLTGNASATYQWFNNGNQKPQGKPFVAAPVEFLVSGDFNSGQNGQIDGTLTVLPPPPPEDFLTHHHAANWVAKLDVSYTNVVVTDTTNGVSTLDNGFNLDQTATVFISV
jgi:hypothetical protein